MTKESVVIVNGVSLGLSGAVAPRLDKAGETVLLQMLISFQGSIKLANRQ